MRLRSRLVLILMMALALYIGFHYFLQTRLIQPSYIDLERNEAAADLRRCLAALEREIDYLDTFNDDWAAWDDTYRFMQARDETYIDSNLGRQTFEDNHLDCIAILDTQHGIVWAGVYDPAGDALSDLPARDAECLAALIDAAPRRGLDPFRALRGVVTTARGPMLVSARPILTSDRQGPEKGTLVMGRGLTPDLIARLNLQTGVPHEIWRLTDDSLPAAERQVLNRVPPDAPLFLPEDSLTLAVYTTVADIAGRPVLLVKARLPRHIHAEGVKVARISLLSDLMVGLVLLTVVGIAIHGLALIPLSRLTRHAAHIRATNDLTLRSGLEGKDEIGQLAREFDNLLNRLQQVCEGLESRVAERTADLAAVNARLEREVRERIKAEAALRVANERLESEVAARTKALTRTNVELQQAIEKRQERDRELDAYHERLRMLSSRLVLAEERERRRIAILLHDHIGQNLTVAKLQFDALAASLPNRGDECRAIGERLTEVIHAVRTLTFEISPPILYDFGLEAALEWLAEQVREKHRLDVSFVDDHRNKPLDEASRILLFQVARELLLNIVKHSRARRAAVTVARRDNFLRLVFEDDGRGFDTEDAQRHTMRNVSFGLFSIRERLRNMGGRLDIISHPGQGTRISIEAPLQEPPPPSRSMRRDTADSPGR